jgi:hypothetical protein
MPQILLTLLAAAAIAVSAPVSGQPDKTHTDRERKEDIARHRALAVLHEAAAKCLESGKPEKECLAQLARDCKGLGIGKYCGMKHRH